MRSWFLAAAAFTLLAPALPADACRDDCGRAYGGRKITIDMQDADIANVIRLIGDVSGKNVVFGDDVKGKVTLKLKNVPWDQALDVVLRSHGYARDTHGDIIFIAPEAALNAEEARRLELLAKRELSGPLTTRIIPCNYTPAREMADKVKAMLSPRGTVTVDERTNTLIVRDIRTSPAFSP